MGRLVRPWATESTMQPCEDLWLSVDVNQRAADGVPPSRIAHARDRRLPAGT